ncbi:hypothetical protein C7974DRAFT_416957 [Boeremia exigua]|uniref:uncharacterized protein n=1 Tax=Boeremia exigua TaxID=749465 RepID=UPI001E8D6729|nr:uncharacterized protein C7974DRAFT_416957 [Boeremia exigua]KAH6616844.1 hypothetical protein C7974DRAFT_416957 [Boeremia exigua]
MLTSNVRRAHLHTPVPATPKTFDTYMQKTHHALLQLVTQRGITVLPAPGATKVLKRDMVRALIEDNELQQAQSTIVADNDGMETVNKDVERLRVTDDSPAPHTPSPAPRPRPQERRSYMVDNLTIPINPPPYKDTSSHAFGTPISLSDVLSPAQGLDETPPSFRAARQINNQLSLMLNIDNQISPLPQTVSLDVLNLAEAHRVVMQSVQYIQLVEEDPEYSATFHDFQVNLEQSAAKSASDESNADVSGPNGCIAIALTVSGDASQDTTVMHTKSGQGE